MSLNQNLSPASGDARAQLARGISTSMLEMLVYVAFVVHVNIKTRGASLSAE